jgi:hypothetical protein
MIPPNDVVQIRLNNLEQAMVEERKRRENQYDKLEDKKADQDDLKSLAEEVHGLRRALVLFSLTMIGTAVVFLMGVLALVQNHG